MIPLDKLFKDGSFPSNGSCASNHNNSFSRSSLSRLIQLLERSTMLFTTLMVLIFAHGEFIFFTRINFRALWKSLFFARIKFRASSNYFFFIYLLSHFHRKEIR